MTTHSPPDFVEGHVRMALTTSNIVTLFFGIVAAVVLMICVLTFLYGSGLLAIGIAKALSFLSSLGMVWTFVTLFMSLYRDFV